jgi:hypothetical protein
MIRLLAQNVNNYFQSFCILFALLANSQQHQAPTFVRCNENKYHMVVAYPDMGTSA